jgi:hypothetical protein
LHSLSDEELLKYFPGTPREDLKAFRLSYPPVIARELAKDNYLIFRELTITPDLMREAEKLVDQEQGEGSFYDMVQKFCAYRSGDIQEKRKQLIRYLVDQGKLKLTQATVDGLLNFQLDTINEENQALELEAFFALRKQGYEELRKLVVGVVDSPPDKATSLNAVYIFRYIN